MLLLLADDSYIMAHVMNERAGSADERPGFKWEEFLELTKRENGSDGSARSPELLEKLLSDYKNRK